MRALGGYLGYNAQSSRLAAPGVWTLRDQCRLEALSKWPKVGGDPFFSYVSLLLSMNGANGSTAFIDTSVTPKTVTQYGSAQISTLQSKFGGSSGLFSGQSDWLTFLVADYSSMDFVFEGWFFFTSIPNTFSTLFAHRRSLGEYGGACLVSANSAGNLQYFIGSSDSDAWQIGGASCGFSITANQWTHLALVRTGSHIVAYKNGQRGNELTLNQPIGSSGNMSLMAGSEAGGQRAFGYVDDFRVTVGSNRGYAGPSFPVPDAPMPAY